MRGTLSTIRDNLGNYEAVAALPSFTLFPWFFVVPGAILLGVVGLGLSHPRRWRASRRVLVALGLGLVLAPAVFQMFSRAPAGGRMMTAFKRSRHAPGSSGSRATSATWPSARGRCSSS